MKHILVVDDEPAISRLIKLNLEATGNYKVTTENRGSQAIETARQCQPDLILLDIMMPDMLGSEVAAALHHDPALSHIKIVFLTAMLKKDEGRSGDEIGGQRILAKPISTDELIQALEVALG